MDSRIFEYIFYFIKIVEYNGINRAAKALQVSAGTLSNAITNLEQLTETQLLIRNSAGITLTGNGEDYYNQFSSLINDFNNKLLLMNSRQLIADGELNIVLPPRLALVYILQHLEKFKTQYPQIKLNAVYHYRDVSLLDDKFDLALSSVVPIKKDFFIRAFVYIKVGIYATESYIKKHGEPKSIAELSDHNVVITSATNGYKHKYVFYNTKTGNYEDVELNRSTCTSDPYFNLKLLGDGDHIGFAMEDCFLDTIPKEEKVVKILTDYKIEPQIFYLIRPTKETDLKVNLFIQFLKKCFKVEDLAK